MERDKIAPIEKIFTEEMFCMLLDSIENGSLARKECLRKGQYYYNMFYHCLEHFEPEIKTLSNKDVDCFYLDEKIDMFVKSLKEEVVGKTYKMGYINNESD